jgi:hypothetical protein
VDKKIEDEGSRHRKKLVSEAVTAVQMTRDALKALEEGKTEDALSSLENATGKLELLVARDPNLAFVPINVTTQVYDLFANADTVEKFVNEAKRALKKGQVQDARRLLDNLASEIVVRVSNLPLATYPAAIKAAVPMIDRGEIEEAQKQLRLALNLFVVDNVVYPLPALRSDIMIKEAEALAEKPDRSTEHSDRLTELVSAVRDEVDLGRALGYMSEENQEEVLSQLQQIEEKTRGGKSGKGFFDKLKDLCGEVW